MPKKFIKIETYYGREFVISTDEIIRVYHEPHGAEAGVVKLFVETNIVSSKEIKKTAYSADTKSEYKTFTFLMFTEKANNIMDLLTNG